LAALGYKVTIQFKLQSHLGTQCYRVKPFVVSLSNHDRLNRSTFDNALLSTIEGFRENG